MQVNQLCSSWQALLLPFSWCFTQPGFRRFVEWHTGLVLNVEEHTVTQSLIAIDRTHDWKALEEFVEYGAWKPRLVEQTLARQIEDAPGRLWHGYRVWAGDDTKVHRSSKNVWGTCTFHEYTARCPNRASTVRAHNWVALGALLENPDHPAWYLPVAGRLYFRKSQLPSAGSNGEPPVAFHTKNELLVAMVRDMAKTVPGKHLVGFDGAFAVRNVVRPLLCPEDGEPRVDVVSRLRQDARLFERPDPERAAGQRGPKPKWGKRLPPPRQGGRWRGGWQEGEVFLYGRKRRVRWKEQCCLWSVAGPDVPVKVVVAKVEGHRKRFSVVSSAVDLDGLQILELFCARFRQEDGFRDLKQRLGWEECRAWTRQPIEVTTLMLFVCMTVLRLVQFQLERQGEDAWWLRPPWNQKKDRPSVLDLGRLMRRYQGEIRAFLSEWLGNEEKSPAAADREDAA